MAYYIYKLQFPNGIHIGNSMAKLEQSDLSMPSDKFFSAIYNEYMKIYNDDELYKLLQDDGVRVSDLLPFKADKLYIKKPYVSIERKQKNNKKEVDRKKVKALNYIPIEQIKSYFSFLKTGNNFPEVDTELGERQLLNKNMIKDTDENNEIYTIEIFKFYKEAGLYFIVDLPKEWKEKFDNLIDSLGYTGIGGKKSIGFGIFNVIGSVELQAYKDKKESKSYKFMMDYLFNENSNYISISSYAPTKEEITAIKNGNSYYQLSRKSGFINSPMYSSEPQKRKQLFMFDSGSTFDFKPKGRLVDLKLYGDHSIFRLGRPIVLGVNYD